MCSPLMKIWSADATESTTRPTASSPPDHRCAGWREFRRQALLEPEARRPPPREGLVAAIDRPQAGAIRTVEIGFQPMANPAQTLETELAQGSG